MNMRYDKTKVVITFATSLALMVVMLSPTAILPAIDAMQQGTVSKLNLKETPPAQETSCTDILTKKIQEKGLSIDNEKAKSLAISNTEFKTRIQGYIPQFNSVNIIGSYDPKTCAVTWDHVNVVYSLNNAKGYVKSIYVAEDPSLANITSFVEKIDKHVASSNSQTDTWSGYEFYHPVTPGGITQIYEAKSTWTIPTITNPGNPTPGNCANECDMDIWPGLEDSVGGGSYLVQAGSDSNIGCSTCSATYELWYTFLTNGSPTINSACTGFTPTVGDSITTDISDTTKNIHASSSTYVISFVDNTHSNSGLCGTSGTSFGLNDPLYAPFIVERASTSGSAEELGEWSSGIPVTGKVDWSGTLSSIYTPYNAGDYTFDNMTNPQPADTYQNTIVGTPNGGGTYDTWWNTSLGTP